MSNEPRVTAHQIMQALATYQLLAQVFDLKEAYDRRFWEQQTDETRLVFETLHEGEFEGAHSFSFRSLIQAIAEFERLLAPPPREVGWQQPEPYSFERHIRQPQVVGEYWEFREDLKDLIGLNRHFARIRTRPGYHFFLRLVEDDVDEQQWELCSFGPEDPFLLHVRFQARGYAQAFIERLNTYVARWVAITDLDGLFEYLDIADPDGELIRDLEDPNYEGLEDELRGSLSLGVYTRLFENGLEIYDDDNGTSHSFEYPFDIRELLFYRDRFKYLNDWYALTDELGVETAPREVEHLYAAVRLCFDAKWQDAVELKLVESVNIALFVDTLTLRIGLAEAVLEFPCSVEQFKQAVAQVQQAQEQPQEQPQGGQS